MYTIVGHCPHCGAPIYSPFMWHGIIPPTTIRSCKCIPSAPQYELVTTTSNNIPIKDIQDIEGFKVKFEEL